MSKKYNKYIGSEASFQVAVANYLRTKKVLFTHPPNGGNRFAKEAAHLKRQGVSKGCPDLLIFEPRGNNIGLALELKTNYNKPSEEQTKWLVDLALRGWCCKWSNSLDEVVELIDGYLDQKPLIIK